MRMGQGLKLHGDYFSFSWGSVQITDIINISEQNDIRLYAE